MVILDQEIEQNSNLFETKAMMPCRVLVKDTTYGSKTFATLKPGTFPLSEEEFLELADTEDIYNTAWQIWLHKYLTGKKMLSVHKPCLAICFAEKIDETVSKSWNDKSDDLFDIVVVDKSGTNIDCKEAILKEACKNKNLFLYDRHANSYGELAEKGISHSSFYELYDKNSADFVSIFRPYHQETSYEMVEAALLKLLIIDERVAEVAYSKIVTGNEIHPYKQDQGLFGIKNYMSRLNVAMREGVTICTHVNINGEGPLALHQSVKGQYPQIHVEFFLGETKGIKVKIINHDDKKSITIDAFDCLIIHQGVLENFFKNYKTKEDYERLLSSLSAAIPYIFIDSGRGIPPKLPDHIKFIPFSLLEEYIMKMKISKYSLVKMIMSLYRRGK